MTIDIASPLSLRRASAYTDPGDPAAIIPDVYGDFSAGGVAGPIPAMLINKAGYVYAAAGHAVQSIDAVYDGVTLKTAGVDYTATVASNYEGQGTIAIIDFVAQPTGAVTWRGVGKAVAANPITQLEDLLATRAGAVAGDYVTASLEAARSAAAVLGYTTAWVVADDQPVSSWIMEFLLNVYGGWSQTGDRRIALWLEGDAWEPSDLAANVVAHRDCVDGDDGVKMVGTERDLCNALTVYYLYNWALGQPSSRLTDLSDDVSVNAYGEVRKSVTLRGHRVAAQVRTWAPRFFGVAAARTRVEGAVVTFDTKDARLAHVTVGDRIGFSWSWGPAREEGHSFVNEVLRVIGLTHSFSTQPRAAVTALCLGRYVVLAVLFDADVLYDAEVSFGGGRDTSEWP